jgi:hypothetical protein
MIVIINPGFRSIRNCLILSSIILQKLVSQILYEKCRKFKTLNLKFINLYHPNVHQQYMHTVRQTQFFVSKKQPDIEWVTNFYDLQQNTIFISKSKSWILFFLLKLLLCRRKQFWCKTQNRSAKWYKRYQHLFQFFWLLK